MKEKTVFKKRNLSHIIYIFEFTYYGDLKSVPALRSRTSVVSNSGA